ncbi:hypothetical protein CF65_00199 [Aggregatibacter actinomycetemcomitans HK1651]|nr:hypothetical protein CF65_00199 [Aggregatibacter actinomycetemcomitans HK1651]
MNAIFVGLSPESGREENKKHFKIQPHFNSN